MCCFPLMSTDTHLNYTTYQRQTFVSLSQQSVWRMCCQKGTYYFNVGVSYNQYHIHHGCLNKNDSQNEIGHDFYEEFKLKKQTHKNTNVCFIDL